MIQHTALRLPNTTVHVTIVINSCTYYQELQSVNMIESLIQHTTACPLLQSMSLTSILASMCHRKVDQTQRAEERDIGLEFLTKMVFHCQTSGAIKIVCASPEQLFCFAAGAHYCRRRGHLPSFAAVCNQQWKRFFSGYCAIALELTFKMLCFL